jgi:hypothetical protein
MEPLGTSLAPLGMPVFHGPGGTLPQARCPPSWAMAPSAAAAASAKCVAPPLAALPLVLEPPECVGSPLATVVPPVPGGLEWGAPPAAGLPPLSLSFPRRVADDEQAITIPSTPSELAGARTGLRVIPLSSPLAGEPHDVQSPRDYAARRRAYRRPALDALGVRGKSESELAYGRGGIRMHWVTPTFVEIDMSAEIGSYQDDFDGI